jgi:hypothetical protein
MGFPIHAQVIAKNPTSWQSSPYASVQIAPKAAHFPQIRELARSLLFGRHTLGAGGYPAMYDREFFTSKLGVAALVSIAAMVTFNVFALTHQLDTTSGTVVVTAPVVELA